MAPAGGIHATPDTCSSLAERGIDAQIPIHLSVCLLVHLSMFILVASLEVKFFTWCTGSSDLEHLS